MDNAPFALSILSFLPSSARQQLTEERLACMRAISELQCNASALRAALEAAIVAMESARDSIEGYVDVRDGSDGTQQPNPAMHADSELQRAIEAARKALSP